MYVRRQCVPRLHKDACYCIDLVASGSTSVHRPGVQTGSWWKWDDAQGASWSWMLSLHGKLCSLFLISLPLSILRFKAFLFILRCAFVPAFYPACLYFQGTICTKFQQIHMPWVSGLVPCSVIVFPSPHWFGGLIFVPVCQSYFVCMVWSKLLSWFSLGEWVWIKKDLFYFIWLFYLCVCMCTMCTPGTHEILWNWNSGWLWTAMWVGAGSQTQVLCKSSKCLTPEPFLQPSVIFFT